MIQFLSVSKKFKGGIVAIEDISFEIEEGEFVFLVGPSGSGKTSIIKLLIREDVPTEGKVFFNNVDITKFSRNQVYQLRRKIGVIFQDFKLIPELTAAENIAFAMEAAGKSEREIAEKVPYLLDIVGLSHRSESFPVQLSGGEQQRVAIARAMSNDPALLIADEPTGNLDPDSAWDIVQILTKINNWGTTVIMSTHSFDVVNTLHKRVIKMEYGKLIKDIMKGSYDDLDDFSLKVLAAKKKDKLSVNTKKIEANADNVADVAAKTEDIAAEKVENDANDEKESSKDSTTKSSKADDLAEQVSGNEDAILESASEVSLDDLDLSKQIKKALLEQGYNDLADLIKAGMPELQKVNQLKKGDLKKIAKIIEKFISKLPK